MTVLSAVSMTSAFRCNEFEGFGYFPDPHDCRAFYQCDQDGRQLQRYCARGMHWRVTGLGLGYCDVRENTLCAKPTSHEEYEMLIFTCPKDTKLGFINGHFPNPVNCVKYYLCLDGIAYDMVCPLGLLWSPRLGYCDVPMRVNCNRKITVDGKVQTSYGDHTDIVEEVTSSEKMVGYSGDIDGDTDNK